MNRWGRISIAAFALFGFWIGSGSCLASMEEKTAARLEAEYDREPNPKKRVKLAIELTEERLKQLKSVSEAEGSGKGPAGVEDYISAIGRLEKALKETSGIGATKDAEIHLRQQARELENLRMSLSYNERGPVEKAAARVTKLHEEVLYSIMNPRKGAATR